MPNVSRHLLASLLIATVATQAQAAYTDYTFTASGTASGDASLLSLLAGNLTVQGQFSYNPDAPALTGAAASQVTPGYTAYSGVGANDQPLYHLSGQVGGFSFADTLGLVAVGNGVLSSGSVDVVSLLADPRTGGTAFPIQGFTVGNYTLSNVRLNWSGNLVDSNAMPSLLPQQPGSVSLDFLAAGSTTVSTVTIGGLQAAPVPEPASVLLAGLGLATVAWRRARRT